MQAGIDVPGRVEVFGGDAEGFKDGDLVVVDATGFLAREDFAELAFDVGVGDAAFLFWDEVITRFVKQRFIAVGEKAGSQDGGRIQFPGRGCAGADGVDVGARSEGVAGYYGLAGRGDGADDVGVFDGGGRVQADVDGDPVTGLELFSKRGCVVFVAAPEVDVVDGAYEGDGLGVSFGLFARAKDGEGCAVGSA